MTISIHPPQRQGIPRSETKFALQQDRWNDFGYQTQYHLYYRQEGNASPRYIGAVAILRQGQTDADGIQIQAPFDVLDDQFCSVGRSLDYYQRLNEMPESDRDEVLEALRDVVARPGLQAAFANEEGWRVSLFRDEADIPGYLTDAEMILTANFTALADLDVTFSFRAAGWTTDLALEFQAPNDILTDALPQRIVVIIGRNGSGKSTLLARLARVGFASPAERATDELAALGIFTPPTIGFRKIVAISYSALDNFAVPGLTIRQLEQIADDIEAGQGRYIYAGLRDIAKEIRNDVASFAARNAEDEELVTLGDHDRNSSTELKSPETLAGEFDRLYNDIVARGDLPYLERVLEPILQDPSLAEFAGSPLGTIVAPSPRHAFLTWSTGHKIAFHVIVSLVAHVDTKTLVLFDEPEMHLHPPLIAALLRALRTLLDRHNALAILATHSPVVVQETLSRHVRVARRRNLSFEISSPTLQTFGQNIGSLTHDTFGLTGSNADFYHTLDQLTQFNSTIEEVNEYFDPPLSGQALAYAMARLARRAGQ